MKYTVLIRDYCDYFQEVEAGSIREARKKVFTRMDRGDFDDVEAGDLQMLSMRIGSLEDNKESLCKEAKQRASFKSSEITEEPSSRTSSP